MVGSEVLPAAAQDRRAALPRDAGEPAGLRAGWRRMRLRFCVAASLCTGLVACQCMCDSFGTACGTIEEIGDAFAEIMVPLMETESGRAGRAISVAVASPMNHDFDTGRKCLTPIGRRIGSRIYYAIGRSNASGKAFELTTRSIVSAFEESAGYRGDWWDPRTVAQWGDAQSVKYLVRGEYFWDDPALGGDRNMRMLSVHAELLELETGLVRGVASEVLGPFPVDRGRVQGCDRPRVPNARG